MSNDLNEAEIKNLSVKIAAVFYVYTIVITAMRLLGYGESVISLMDAVVFDYYPLMTKGAYLLMAIPVAISVYAWKMKFNERSRKLVGAFALCSALNHIPILVLLPLAILLSKGGGGGPFYESIQFWACFTLFSCAVWLFWMCRRLGRLKPAEDAFAAAMESIACLLLIAALFVVSCMLSARPLLTLRTRHVGDFSAAATSEAEAAIMPATIGEMRASGGGKCVAVGEASYLIVRDAVTNTLPLSDGEYRNAG